MHLKTLFIILALLFAVELFYLRLANFFNIADKPNLRSSHYNLTIRGGGIIFTIAAIVFFIFFDFQYPFFIFGLILISLISFLDDILTLSSKLRLIIQVLSVCLLFTQWGLWGSSYVSLIIGLFIVIGTINAYNFMDGINGITGAYSLVTLVTLIYVNLEIVKFISMDFLMTIVLSLIVFNFFNFRVKAKCFAGDVGSVGIAFILMFVIGMLILRTGNFLYLLFLLMYGLDVITTITFRLLSGEKIYEAHRRHFYQYLVNEQKFSHLKVAISYAIIQLCFNFLIISSELKSLISGIIVTFVAFSFFILIRILSQGKNIIKRVH